MKKQHKKPLPNIKVGFTAIAGPRNPALERNYQSAVKRYKELQKNNRLLKSLNKKQRKEIKLQQSTIDYQDNKLSLAYADIATHRNYIRELEQWKINEQGATEVRCEVIRKSKAEIPDYAEINKETGWNIADDEHKARLLVGNIKIMNRNNINLSEEICRVRGEFEMLKLSCSRQQVAASNPVKPKLNIRVGQVVRYTCFGLYRYYLVHSFDTYHGEITKLMCKLGDGYSQSFELAVGQISALNDQEVGPDYCHLIDYTLTSSEEDKSKV